MIGFILTRHVNSIQTNEYWQECYKCIRQFYPENPIVIIDDNSNPTFVSWNQTFDLYKCEIIHSEYPGSGEILPYYYYYTRQFPFEKAVIIHDSVFIKEYIEDFENDLDIQFLWEFEHHWNNIIEDTNLIRKLNHSDVLLNKYLRKQEWKGSFGAMSVISLKFLKKIQEKYNIFSILTNLFCREDRSSFERVFAVICKNEYPDGLSIFGNIHLYMKWGYTYKEYLTDFYSTKKIEEDYTYPIVKVWTGR